MALYDESESMPGPKRICPMNRLSRLLPLALPLAACISTTTSARTTASIDNKGTPNVTALASLGAGLTFDERSAFNIEVDLGVSDTSPLVIGETLSYTRMGEKRGLRAGLSARGSILGDDEGHANIFGQVLIPLDHERSRSSSADGGKSLSVSTTRNRYWNIGFGPEFGMVAREGSVGVELGLTVRLSWHKMSLWELH